MRQDSGVVGESLLVDCRAVVLDISAVVHVPCLMINKFGVEDPVPGLLCMFGIGIVAGIPSESGANVEKTTIGNCYKSSRLAFDFFFFSFFFFLSWTV
jgi:hypothetical protein